MPTLVCDLDGVVYLGETEIPGSGAALAALQAAGWRLLFCTNNATRTPEDSAAKIARVTGFPVGADSVVTSAQAAATLLDPGTTAFVLGGDGLMRAVAERGVRLSDDWDDVDAVVVGLDPALTYERLSIAVLGVGRGARFVASNHDPTYPTPEGARPGAGAIVAAVRHATGVEPEFAGKPHPAIRALLASKTEGEVWIVGDRDDTDLAMGRAEGWNTALVATGVASRPAQPPTVTVDDLAALARHLLE
jgi:HAD superfamily hydrolase (TIGR01450 family)